MKIYMIHPRFSDLYWGLLPWWSSRHHVDSLDRFGAIDVLGVDAYMPPIALVTLAALTPPEIELELVDNNAGTPINFDKACDLVVLTAYTNQLQEVKRITARFQARGIPVALGGPQASTAPHECTFVDHLFVGEAELTWPQFLREFQAGQAKSRYEQPEKIDMALSPVPRWEMLDLSRYADGTVQTTRGCPFDCEYCDVIVFNGHSPRSKPIETVVEDIRRQALGGIETIFISDDNFIGNKGYARKLLERLKVLQQELPRPVALIAQLTINVAHDDKLLRALADANFVAVFIGVETPRRVSLEECQKPQNYIRDLKSDLQRIGAFGIVPVTGLITGFDNDDPTIFDEQLTFINETPLLVTRCNILTAIPHTQFWHRMKEEGRLVPEEVRLSDPSPMMPNFYPVNFTRESLLYGHLQFVEKVWSAQNMERRLRQYLSQVEYVSPVAHHRPSRKQLAILARLFRKMMLESDAADRRVFMRMLYDVLRLNPKAMRAALFSLMNGMASRHVAQAVLAKESPGLQTFQRQHRTETSSRLEMPWTSVQPQLSV
ncbi:MAG: radical SAM protein [Myxococcota bacterium]